MKKTIQHIGNATVVAAVASLSHAQTPTNRNNSGGSSGRGSSGSKSGTGCLGRPRWAGRPLKRGGVDRQRVGLGDGARVVAQQARLQHGV